VSACRPETSASILKIPKGRLFIAASLNHDSPPHQPKRIATHIASVVPSRQR